MRKVIFLLFSASALVMADDVIEANLGSGFSGTWSVYNLSDQMTIGSNSLEYTATNYWGGPTAWIVLDNAITLDQNQVLTFSYNYDYGINSIYGISFFNGQYNSNPGLLIGTTEYGSSTLAATMVTEKQTSGQYFGYAQALRFNVGNSSDRFQGVSYNADTMANVTLGSTGALTTAEIAWNTIANQFELTLSSGDSTDSVLIGESLTFDHLIFAADGAVPQSFTNMAMSITTVPEPATASLSLLGLAALMMRRRRVK